MYKLLIIGIVCLIPGIAFSQLEIELEPFATGLSLPLDVVSNGTDRLYVIEKAGTIAMIDADGNVLADKFLDITDRVDASRSEMGLLGLAFHPDFLTNGEFYVNYTDSRGLTAISRFKTMQFNRFKGDPDSEERIIQIAQPYNNHNGGDLAFGPDGYLYIASGDGGNANDPHDNGQTGTILLGKLLRIDVDTSKGYRIPADNPFVNDPRVSNEIWALGLRNPWRMSFDRATGDLWIGDVGQGSWEEIDFQPASSPGGENYGWRCYEGNHQFNATNCQPPENYTFPIYEYRNNRVTNGCSVTGGVVYRGGQFPDLTGLYIYCDYCSGKFWALDPSDTTNVLITDERGNNFVGFGEDDNGELYVAGVQDGTIYKITTACSLQIDLTGTDESCPDANDGSIDLTISDTTAMVDILWSNGDTTEDISNLPPGQYTVRVTGGGCDLEATFEIDSSDLMPSCLIDSIITDWICEGDTIILNACDAPPGYEYQWHLFDAIIATTQTPQFAVTESGTYSVAFIGDCNLGISEEIEITFTELPEQPALSRSQDTLFADIQSDLYRWYLNDTLVAETMDPYFVPTASGDYRVAGVNGVDCEGDLSDILTVILTSTREQTVEKYLILPNPSDGRFVINGDLEAIQELTVWNVSGKEMPLLKESDSIVDLSSAGSGIYFVRIRTVEGIQTSRVVVK